MRPRKAWRKSALRSFHRPRVWLGIWIFGWALAIAGSLLPAALMPPMPDLPDGDKWMHLVAYFLLGFWAMATFGAAWAQGRALVALAILGVALEFAQATLTANRFGEGLDMAANVLGLALAWMVGQTRAGRVLEAVDRGLR